MEDQRDTEKRAATLLLQRGVKVKVATPLFFRLFFGKKMTFYVKAMSVEKLLKIASIFLEMGIENTEEMSIKEGFQLFKMHGKKMSEIIALSIDGKLPYRLRARILRKNLTEKEFMYLFNLVIAYGGVEDFINTIRLAEATRITKPMNLSPEEKTS